MLNVIHRVWHFMSIQFPPRRRTKVHFHTLSWFKCFLIEKLWGKQWLLIWQAVVILTENVEPWMWKMSACLEMQSFFLTHWSTRRQTNNTPGTLWWDFFNLFGVLWHCCNPNYVSQGREEIPPPVVKMPCTLVLAQAISATPFTSSWVQGQQQLYLQNSQWPQWCPCGNSAALSGRDWSAAALPWHYSPYTSPFLSNKPQDHIS